MGFDGEKPHFFSYLSPATKPSGQRRPSAERNWGYSVNPYHLLPAFPHTKNRSGFFWKNGFLFGYIHHVQPRKNPMAAEGQQWLASNWGGDHNTENQQFHGEEHHDQCEHLRIGELLAFGFSNGRTLLRLKEMVHHKIPWSRGKSMAVKILRP